MTPALQADPLPLRTEEDGGIRVGDTRVHLEILMAEYKKGRTPEDIVRSYDTLKLADVYAVIAYYLRHTEEVEAYLARRDQEADALYEKLVAAGITRPDFWKELLARRARMGNGDAATPGG
jgi:uncharacterized protein (DUF433 family)